MSNSTLLVTSIQNGVTEIRFNRPELHNAFDDQFIAQFIKVLNEVDCDPNIRVVVIAANGKCFSAGADLNWMKRMAQFSQEENLRDAKQLAKLMQTLNHLQKPTIAIVEGAAFGGGVGLLACCDVVLATTHSSFCFSEVKIGLSPAVISPYVLARIGQSATRRFFLTAEKISAVEAKQIGLAHEVVEPEQLTEKLHYLVQHFLHNSPQAIAQTKLLVADVTNREVDEKLIQHTCEKIAAIRVSKEGQEGLHAFLNKRAASWQSEE